jgi:pimeloyl-ACP methyl ester carboxylesterase
MRAMTAAEGELLRLPDGRRVQLWQGGAPEGRPVLFFHGCPDTRRVAFSGAGAARRAGLRLIAVNRPGYGGSDAAASDHLSVATDTAAVADLLGIDSFGVLGMSIGGPYALACAAVLGERVTAAAVVSAPGDIARMDPPWHRDDLSGEQQAFLRQVAATGAEEAAELFRPEFAAWRATIAPDDPDDDELARRWNAELPPLDAELRQDTPASEVAASAREALTQVEGYLQDAATTFRPWAFDLAAIRCPTTVWCGERDTNHPPRNARWLADHIAGASLVVQPTGHLGTLLRHWDPLCQWLAAP